MMPSNNEIARDLTVLYLQNNYVKNLSPKDLIKLYKETHKKFEDLLAEPLAKVIFFDKNKLF